jgi:hypothetical protein
MVFYGCKKKCDCIKIFSGNTNYIGVINERMLMPLTSDVVGKKIIRRKPGSKKCSKV